MVLCQLKHCVIIFTCRPIDDTEDVSGEADPDIIQEGEVVDDLDSEDESDVENDDGSDVYDEDSEEGEDGQDSDQADSD